MLEPVDPISRYFDAERAESLLIIALAPQAGLMLALDYFAEQRGEVYLAFLTGLG